MPEPNPQQQPGRELERQAGLREIARALATPARSGLVLTRERLRELMSRLALPVGPGDRAQMLAQAFESAAESAQLAALLATLTAEVERWSAIYAGWAVSYPSSVTIWDDWQ